jgi:hypothetical protein
MAQPLSPDDRVYMREVFGTNAGRRYLAVLIGMRPALGGKTTEQSAMSAHEALGYERCMSNMAMLLDEPTHAPDVKKVNIAED